MLVSVILPVKNEEKTILAAVKSVLDQSYTDLELIIIDDGCNDGTIVNTKSIDDQRLKVIKNKGKGIAAALNTGIANAKGEYIARMDADDFSYPERIESQVEYLSKHPEIDVISCLVVYDAALPREGYQRYVNWINSIITPDEHYANRFADAPLAHPTILCRREVFERAGWYCEDDLPEDFELWLRWMANGVRIAKQPRILYRWTDRPNRASRVSSVYRQENFFKVKSTALVQWLRHQPELTIWVWGYGKEVFRKSSYLIKAGIRIYGYIDVQSHPGSERRIIHYSQIKGLCRALILIYVSDRKGKQEIRAYLDEQQLRMGRDYFFMV